MYSKSRVGFGKFVRVGQGSGKLRLSLQVPAGDQMSSLIQISDGELLSTIVSIGKHSMRSQVDLGKVRERLSITSQSLHNPTVAMYLAIGGQAELLRRLIQQYQWLDISEGQLGQQKVWWLKGQRTEEPLDDGSQAQVDLRLHDASAEMLPTQASVAIGHTESAMPFWLYQVEQWSLPKPQDKVKLRVVTEWDAPTVLTSQQLDPEWFRLAAGDNLQLQETREETKLYLPPLGSAATSEGNSVRY
ncbi:MAG: hypothetical protein KF752_18640 [Pirellulaceae bacterium]|nr:hypothetical protein [Pirellulaceae bacterium]